MNNNDDTWSNIYYDDDDEKILNLGGLQIGDEINTEDYYSKNNFGGFSNFADDYDDYIDNYRRENEYQDEDENEYENENEYEYENENETYDDEFSTKRSQDDIAEELGFKGKQLYSQTFKEGQEFMLLDPKDRTPEENFKAAIIEKNKMYKINLDDNKINEIFKYADRMTFIKNKNPLALILAYEFYNSQDFYQYTSKFEEGDTTASTVIEYFRFIRMLHRDKLMEVVEFD